MNKLRNPMLRRFFTVIFLLSSLYTQTQTLFACDLMGGGPQITCCCDEHMEKGCPMGGGCQTPPGEAPTGCCDVTVEVEMQDPAATSTVDLLDAAQPPPAISTSAEIALALSEESDRTSFDFHPPPSWLTGTHTYLTTQRFRI